MNPAIVTGVPGWLGSRLVHTLFDGLADGPEGLGHPDRVVSVLVFGKDSVEEWEGSGLDSG